MGFQCTPCYPPGRRSRLFYLCRIRSACPPTRFSSLSFSPPYQHGPLEISRGTMTGKRITLFSAGVLILAAIAFSRTALPARANLTNNKRENIGTTALKETSQGVSLSLTISNLLPGVHGFHIHAVGKCGPPAFKSPGGHFNPEGRSTTGKIREGT